MFNEKEIKEIEVVEEYNAEIAESVETTEEIVAAGKKNLFAEKMNLFGKKAKENAEIALKKAGELSKSTAEQGMEALQKGVGNVQKSVADLQEKLNDENYQKRLKKYNPVFPEQYHSSSFNIPNMIMIVDGADRRNIDVCEGSIGWIDNSNEVEILCLYEKAVEESGLQFIPMIASDTAYYVDRFDRNRFIQIETIFNKAHEERMAELEHIAFSLGAKKFSVEISEENIEVEDVKKKAAVKGAGLFGGFKIKSEEKMEQSSAQKNYVQRRGINVTEFDGGEPRRPTLKWFMYDDTIRNLIEMRCSNTNAIKSKELILEGAVSAVMSRKTAYAIDNTVGKIGAGGNVDMTGQATRENKSKMIFKIEF